jgi:6-phosphofructokinase 1
MRIGLLTGGGDCPGLNAVIRAIVRGAARSPRPRGPRRSATAGAGVLATTPGRCREAVSGILHRGGTILGRRGTTPTRTPGGIERCVATVGGRSLDGIVAIGGEGTLGVACEAARPTGVSVIGVPKTIDNDLAGNDYTVRLPHRRSRSRTDAIDRLHSTAEIARPR